jgi:hypothetical protein
VFRLFYEVPTNRRLELRSVLSKIEKITITSHVVQENGAKFTDDHGPSIRIGAGFIDLAGMGTGFKTDDSAARRMQFEICEVEVDAFQS